MAVEQKSPITRRAVAKGIAWSVPAFAVATAAPALAQSPLVTFDPTGFVCKYPGGSVSGVKQAYLFPVTITNTSNEEVRITALSAYVMVDGEQLDGDPEFWTDYPHVGGTSDSDGILTGVPGQSNEWVFVVDETGNSQQTAGTVYLTVLVEGLETGRSYEYTVELEFPVTPPCDGDFGDDDVAATSSETDSAESASLTEPTGSAPAVEAPADEMTSDPVPATGAGSTTNSEEPESGTETSGTSDIED